MVLRAIASTGVLASTVFALLQPSENEATTARGAIDDLDSPFNSYEKLPGTSVSSKYIRGMRIIMKRRRLLKTEEGGLGLSPEETPPGDKLCAIPGCDSPLILRPTVNESQVIIGEGYFRDAAYGEALLGSLPKASRPILRLHPDGP